MLRPTLLYYKPINFGLVKLVKTNKAIFTVNTEKQVESYFCFIVVVLLVFNVYLGNRLLCSNGGLLNYLQLTSQRQQKQHVLDVVTQQNKERLDNIMLLDEKHLDIDFLDEMARKSLNYSDRREKLIVYHSK